MSQYIGLNLIYGASISLALSALSKCIPAMTEEYITGLWEAWFINDLLWDSTSEYHKTSYYYLFFKI